VTCLITTSEVVEGEFPVHGQSQRLEKNITSTFMITQEISCDFIEH